MGILSSNMDPIEKAKHYIEQLKDVRDRLDQISLKLVEMKKESNVDADEYERLYEKEFEVSMTLYGIHEDIHRILDYAKTRENTFIITRLKQEADKVFKPMFVEI